MIRELFVMPHSAFRTSSASTLLARPLAGLLRFVFWDSPKIFLAPYLLFDNANVLEDLPSADVDTLFPQAHAALEAGGKGRLSILFLTPSLVSGGAERQLSNLAAKLHAMGHRVRVRALSLDGPAGHYADVLAGSDIDLKEFHSANRKSVFLSLARYGLAPELMRRVPPSIRFTTAALTEELLRDPADVVHAYLDHTNIAAGWAGLFSGTPVVRMSWRNRNPSNFAFYEPWMGAHYSFFLKHPRVSAEGNARSNVVDYAAWLNRDPESFFVSPNGIDASWAGDLPENAGMQIRPDLGIPRDAPVVLCICRIDPEKRPLDLVQVFERVTRHFPTAHCIHAGMGSMHALVIDRLSRCDPAVRSRIHFLGRRKDIPTILSTANVVLLCSQDEGMPNAVMEAMLLGIPVVATRVGGTPELVVEHETGFLYAAGDVNGLADGIARLLQNSGLARRMGNAGKERIAAFSMSALADRTLESYRPALAQAGASLLRPLSGPMLLRSFWKNFQAYSRWRRPGGNFYFRNAEEVAGADCEKRAERTAELAERYLGAHQEWMRGCAPSAARVLAVAGHVRQADILCALYTAQMGCDTTVAFPHLPEWDDAFHTALFGKLAARHPGWPLLEKLLRTKRFDDVLNVAVFSRDKLDFAAENAFDLIYSYDSLQASTRPKKLCEELFRVSAHGCRHAHLLDLRYQENPLRPLDHLLFSPRDREQCPEKGCRFRKVEWLDFFRQAGFADAAVTRESFSSTDNYFYELMNNLHASSCAYTTWPEDDIRIDSIELRCGKPARGNHDHIHCKNMPGNV